MSLTPLDANMIFGLGAFVFFQIAKRSGSPAYQKQRKLITLGPPSWVFGVMWTIIYTFLTVSAYYAFTTVTANYTAMICVFFVNIMLNKYWSVLFFDYDQHLLALFVLPLDISDFPVNSLQKLPFHQGIPLVGLRH